MLIFIAIDLLKMSIPNVLLQGIYLFDLWKEQLSTWIWIHFLYRVKD